MKHDENMVRVVQLTNAEIDLLMDISECRLTAERLSLDIKLENRHKTHFDDMEAYDAAEHDIYDVAERIGNTWKVYKKLKEVRDAGEENGEEVPW